MQNRKSTMNFLDLIKEENGKRIQRNKNNEIESL